MEKVLIAVDEAIVARVRSMAVAQDRPAARVWREIIDKGLAGMGENAASPAPARPTVEDFDVEPSGREMPVAKPAKYPMVRSATPPAEPETGSRMTPTESVGESDNVLLVELERQRQKDAHPTARPARKTVESLRRQNQVEPRLKGVK